MLRLKDPLITYLYLYMYVHVSYVHTCGLSCPSLAEMSLAFHELYSHMMTLPQHLRLLINQLRHTECHQNSVADTNLRTHLYKYR